MGRISRRAADKIDQMWQAHKGRKPQGAGFADPGLPVRLARTITGHNVGETKDVRLWWGDKGDELGGIEDRNIVPAYNRFVDLAADEWVHIARIGSGWEIITSRRPAGQTGQSCGGCTEPAGTDDIDLGGGLIVSEFYDFDPFCSGIIIFTFEYDTGGVWNATADSLEVICDASPITFSGTLTVTGKGPGEAVIDLSAGGDSWQWTNDVAWQPRLRVPFPLIDGDDVCPCSPFRQFPCLIPRESAG